MSESTSIHNVRAVLTDRIVDDAVVVVEDGRIVAISEGGARPANSVDGRGAFCIPGLVDTHSDGLEKEGNPRPNVSFPHDFALRSFEGRVRAAGVTTMFHGVGFEEDDRHGRTVTVANAIVDELHTRRSSGESLVDHRVLYRLDARDPDGCDALAGRFAVADPLEPQPLVSFEDHTPGQGQYADVEYFRKWMAGSPQYAGQDVDVLLEQRINERAAMLVNRDRNLEWIVPAARAGAIRLMAHDPASAADVEEAVTWGATIAEFPTSVEAARAAIAHGMPTVMGAPNVLRGGSHSGNVAAEELVRLDLCSVIASDYQPTAMLAAVFLLADRGACSLPRAVQLVTAGPASTVGLVDRGRLEEGLRADLVLVTHEGRWPTVRAVQRAADPVLTPAGAAS